EPAAGSTASKEESGTEGRTAEGAAGGQDRGSRGSRRQSSLRLQVEQTGSDYEPDADSDPRAGNSNGSDREFTGRGAQSERHPLLDVRRDYPHRRGGFRRVRISRRTPAQSGARVFRYPQREAGDDRKKGPHAGGRQAGTARARGGDAAGGDAHRDRPDEPGGVH